MKRRLFASSLFLVSLLFVTSALSISLPSGYVIPKETLSPSHRYGFMVPVFDVNRNMENVHDSLVFMKTGKVIAMIDASPGFDRRVNYINVATPWWSKDESLVLWKVDEKWSPRALVLIKFKNNKQVWQRNLLTAFQKEILTRTHAAMPEKYETIKKLNTGNGSAYPEGFIVDVEPVIKADLDKRPLLTLPFEVHVTLTSNPKQLENVPDLNSEMNGVVKQDGSIEIKNFKML